MLTPTLPYTKALEIEPSLIVYIAKSLAHPGDGERDKGYRARDIPFERFLSSHVTFLLIKVCMFVLGFLILLRSLRPSWRAFRCDHTLGRSYCYCQPQLNVSCGPGACTTRYCALNSTVDAFNRHTWIFSETRSWKAATTRMRQSHFYLHEPSYVPCRVNPTLWSRW